MGEPLTGAELRELAKLFPPDAVTRSWLRRKGFDVNQFPVAVAGQRPDDYWDLVNDLIIDGAIENGRLRLLDMGRDRYPYNPVFKRRILLLGASPVVAGTGSALDSLRIDEEYQAVLEAARGMIVEYRAFATAADIQYALDYRPDILHLACHGQGPMLMFHDRLAHQPDPRKARAIHAADLAAALLAYEREHQHRLNGIVLNACFGAEAALELRSCARTIVAYRGELADTAAAQVARELYTRLAPARPLASAARLLKAELPMLDDRGRPVAAEIVIHDVDDDSGPGQLSEGDRHLRHFSRKSEQLPLLAGVPDAGAAERGPHSSVAVQPPNTGQLTTVPVVMYRHDRFGGLRPRNG